MSLPLHRVVWDDDGRKLYTLMKPNDVFEGSLPFLLSLAALPLACTTSDDDDGGSAGTGGGSMTATTMTGGTLDGTASQGSMTTPAGTSGTTDEPDDTTGDATDAGETVDTTSSDVDPLCLEFLAWYELCDPRYAAYAVMFCEEELEYAAMYGRACISATEDYFACTSAIDCRAIEDEACAKEIAAAEQECGR
jgi:hypothetical protein